VIRRLSHVLLLSMLAALLAAGPVAPRAALAQGTVSLLQFKTDTLTIRTADGKAYPFKVEMATTEGERAQGLMFRRSLAPDAGMLFDFGNSQPVTMWMENTLIPLDMLFIAADGHVVNIAQRAVPLSRATIASQGPVKGVLEVPGGTAARLGLKPGDVVQHSMFAPIR
jgi:hypothetical protein